MVDGNDTDARILLDCVVDGRRGNTPEIQQQTFWLLALWFTPTRLGTIGSWPSHRAGSYLFARIPSCAIRRVSSTALPRCT